MDVPPGDTSDVFRALYKKASRKVLLPGKPIAARPALEPRAIECVVLDPNDAVCMLRRTPRPPIATHSVVTYQHGEHSLPPVDGYDKDTQPASG